MLLVIQFRTDQSGPHEVECIYSSSNLPYHEHLFLNAQSEHIFSFDLQKYALKADAVILGGFGESGFEDTDPDGKKAIKNIQAKMEPVFDTITQEDIPTLGICFGYQLLASYLGSSIIKDDKQKETGIAEIHLTDEGAKDPLFENIDNSFHAVIGHKVSVAEQPKDTKLLAYSDLCNIQAFRYKGNVYGCQFHPELDTDDLFKRLQLYPEYMENEIEYDKDTEVKAKTITQQFVENALS